jgi:FixJ family two-component response regulator
MDYLAPSLFVVIDDPDTLDSVSSLASSRGIQLEAFSSADTFLNRFTPSMAGCLLAELCAEGIAGSELQTLLAARGSILPIIFLSVSASLIAVVRAMKNGALTVISAPFRAEELAEAVRRGLEVNRESREFLAKRVEVQRRLDSLTTQERRVLEMIIEGMPNKRITRVFGVSQRTIARLRARVYEKMGVESAFELARGIVNSGTLPVVDGQERSLVSGGELGTHVSRDRIRGVSPEAGGRLAILQPPHFPHDQPRLLSRKSDRQHP